jgi:MoxR-like ATPase
MMVRTDLLGDWIYVTDENSSFDVIVGNPHSYSLIGRAINKFDWLCVSVDEFGDVSESTIYAEDRRIVLFNEIQKTAIMVKGISLQEMKNEGEN